MKKLLTRLDETSKSWLILFMAVFLFIALGLFLLPQPLKNYPAFVADSPSPSGIKAIYTLLNEHTDRVGIWKKDARHAPFLDKNQLMIMVEPYFTFDPEEEKQWIEWMKEGNHIWLFTTKPNDFFDNKITRWSATGKKDPVVRSLTGYHELTGVYQAEIETEIRLVSKNHDDTIWLRDSYGVIALTRSYGEGQLTVAVTPGWFTNEAVLRQEDHLKLLLALLEQTDPDMIWFNDYIHGYSERSTLFEVYPQWLLVLFVQVILILLLWLWMKGKRFGPVERPREWTVRFGSDRIRAMAAWYERGGFYKEALAIQEEYLRRLVQQRWGIAANMSRDEWLEAVLNRLSPEQQKIWKQHIDDLIGLMKKNHISHKMFLQGSKQFDVLLKQVDRERGETD